MKKPDSDSQAAAATEREPAAPATPAVPEARKEPEAPTAAAELVRVTEENRLFQQRLLEMTAELDNQAKRFARERKVVRDESVVRIARELLEVVDNLERVIASIPPADRAGSLATGVSATHHVFLEKLRALGVVPIEVLEKPFDPFEHEAIGSDERADVAPGTVVAEVTRGYRMGLQLVRAARVRVAAALTAAEDPAPPGA